MKRDVEGVEGGVQGNIQIVNIVGVFIMGFVDFLGKEMTTPTKIISGIVSLIILVSLYLIQWIPKVPKQAITIGYGWLAFHIINHLYVAISEVVKKKR